MHCTPFIIVHAHTRTLSHIHEMQYRSHPKPYFRGADTCRQLPVTRTSCGILLLPTTCMLRAAQPQQRIKKSVKLFLVCVCVFSLFAPGMFSQRCCVLARSRVAPLRFAAAPLAQRWPLFIGYHALRAATRRVSCFIRRAVMSRPLAPDPRRRDDADRTRVSQDLRTFLNWPAAPRPRSPPLQPRTRPRSWCTPSHPLPSTDGCPRRKDTMLSQWCP